MAQGHLSNDEFFSKLTALIDKTHQKGHGSVFLVQKRLSHNVPGSSSADSESKQQDDPLADLHPPQPLPLIIRASDGDTQSKDRKKNKDHIKISTIVQPDDIEKFFARYAEVCKAGMQSLRKRDRSKRKKDKGKKKKGGDAEKKP